MAMAIETPPGLGALSGALADLAQTLRPSVVSVRLPGQGGGAGVIWSGALRVGELVFATGHPLGEPYAVALGIVTSPGGAAEVGGQRLPEAVRADLALYPGNSGGPLADAHGRVVGINSMVVPPRLAFAVPSATVARFLAAGSRARLGVRTQRVALPPPLVERLGLPQEYGLMVVEVLEGEAAASAGLLPGDVLLAADGAWLDRPAALAAALDTSGGAAMRLDVLRGGAVRAVVVTPRSAG